MRNNKTLLKNIHQKPFLLIGEATILTKQLMKKRFIQSRERNIHQKLCANCYRDGKSTQEQLINFQMEHSLKKTGKDGKCRSTSAKPAVRRCPQQRTPQAHQTEIKTVKTFKLTHEL